MDKAGWAVLVSVFFTVATQVTPMPERWKPFVIWLSWVALAVSSLGWLGSHLTVTRHWRQIGGKMPYLLAFAIGGVLGVAAWYFVKPEARDVASG